MLEGDNRIRNAFDNDRVLIDFERYVAVLFGYIADSHAATKTNRIAVAVVVFINRVVDRVFIVDDNIGAAASNERVITCAAVKRRAAVARDNVVVVFVAVDFSRLRYCSAVNRHQSICRSVARQTGINRHHSRLDVVDTVRLEDVDCSVLAFAKCNGAVSRVDDLQRMRLG